MARHAACAARRLRRGLDTLRPVDLPPAACIRAHCQDAMSACRRPVVLVTGAAQRLGRAIALDLARARLATWRCTAAVGDAGRRPPWPTLARCRRASAQAFARRPGRRSRLPARWCPRCVRALRPARRGGQQRVALRARRRAELQPCAAMDTPLARQHRAGGRCWRRRCTQHLAEPRERDAAAWSTCSTRSCGTRTPTTSRTPCRKAALQSRHRAAGAGAGAAAARVRRGAGRDAAVGRR